MVREGLKFLLSTALDLDVVGEAANGAEAVELVPLAEPDVVLMDLVMPVMNGADATARIKEAFPAVQVIALTSYADGELVEQTLQAGAISFLLKDSRPEALVQAIRDARDGRGTIDAGAMQSVMTTGRTRSAETDAPRARGPRPARGRYEQPGHRRALVLSVGTVRLHVSNILAKLGAPNRTSAAIIALKHGLD